jgi:raffinose/stachyose/melibiose transport system permease protein
MPRLSRPTETVGAAIPSNVGVAAPRLAVRRGPRPRPLRERIVPYLYIAPTFAVFGLFVFAPFLHSAWLSFFEWDGLTIGRWVGLNNYRDIFVDPEMRSAFGHAGVLVIFFAAIPIVFGLALATALATVRVRGDAFLRTCLILPQVVSMVVVGVTWTWIYALDGPLNQMLRLVGLGGVTRSWLGDFGWALPAVGVIGTWVLVGLCMILFLAGIQQIPPTLYDAVRVDGGGRIREFFTVTLPGVRGEIAVALTLTVIAAIKTFDLVFIATRGGPGRATIVPGLMVYQRAFQDGRVGAACAVGVVLAAMVFAVTVLINWIADKGRT